MASKCTKDAENVYAPLVNRDGVYLGPGNTLAGQTFYNNGSIDTSFDPPLFLLDSTVK
jgi:hypothetical protein